MRLLLILLLLTTPGCAAINSTVEWYRGLPIKPTSASLKKHPNEIDWEFLLMFEVRLEPHRPPAPPFDMKAVEEFHRDYREDRDLHDYRERQR